MNILVIHGPNLNLLGTREPEIYGTETLADLDAHLVAHARTRGVGIECFQSNHEGAIIDRIHSAETTGVAAIVINPGAYTHTSLAIADALRSIRVPAIEAHLSNIHARPGRSRSVTAGACRGLVAGFGFSSYTLAIDAAIALLKS